MSDQSLVLTIVLAWFILGWLAGLTMGRHAGANECRDMCAPAPVEALERGVCRCGEVP
jgi:hypothetical protein